MRKRRTARIILTILCCLLFLAALACVYLVMPMAEATVQADQFSHCIAHGSGNIDGHTYTNSLEAATMSAKNGYKYIEFDLQLTTDGQLVCMHSEKDFREMTAMDDSIPLTTQNFNKQRIYGKYTPLTANDVVALQKTLHFTIITDKTSSPDILERYFADVRQHVMVESFSIDDYIRLKQLGYTPMLSLYTYGYLTPMLKQFLNNDIEWITTAAYTHHDIVIFRILKRLFGIKIAVFTPTPERFKEHIGREIDLIYI